MSLSLERPRTPVARLLSAIERRAPATLVPWVAKARRDVAVVEGRLLLGDRPDPLLYDRPIVRPAAARPAEPVGSASPADAAPSARPAVVTAPRPHGLSLVTVEDDGGTHQVTIAPSQFLLEAALQQNVTLPFSCTLGGCGTCRLQLLEGEIELEEPNCLTPEELAKGFRLSCVGRVTSPTCRVRVLREE